MKLLLRAIIFISLLTITGCATVGPAILQAGTQGDLRFSPKDVDAAILIAQQAGDKVAEACYTAIRKHVDQPMRAEEAVGPVSRYAAARIRIREGRAGLAPDVHTACAPLILDAAAFARDFKNAITEAVR